MAVKDRMIDAFPFVGEMQPAAQLRLLEAVVAKRLTDGQVLAREGDECGYLPFIVAGTLRVYKIGEQGKELTLYRVERGESCILTATCILNSNEFPAIAQAEGETEIVLLPASLFVTLIDEHPAWRRYLFALYSRRLEGVLSVVEEVAFHRVDARIAAYLVEAAHPAALPTVKATHQQVASEVGTSREVVSRILKDLESEGLIAMARGMITLVKPDALQKRAGI